MRLRRSDLTAAGITRVRRGRGLAYLDQNRNVVRDPATLDRIRSLVIPPAWTDVWICPWPHGHIQATGTDAAGRRQYRYHDEWRRQRDAAKHDHVLDIADRLPAARRRSLMALRSQELTQARVLAGAFRLLDTASLRVGGETYAEAHETFGLATLRRDHVSVRGSVIEMDFVGKASKQQLATLRDAPLARLVAQLLSREDDNPELFGWYVGDTWHDMKSSDVNDHLRRLLHTDVSAKDLRTWNATVLMGLRLGLGGAASIGASTTRRRRFVASCYRDVAEYLGNTPAVAKSSYVDPRVVDLFHDGVTVPSSVLPVRDTHLPIHPRVEAAVLRLLEPGTAGARAA